MNREFLFSGRRLRDNVWVFGDALTDSQGMLTHIRYFENGAAVCDECDHRTIRQFTGLLDKNGKKIFEGDIVTHGNQNYLVKWDDNNARFIGVSEFSWNVHRNEYTKGQGNTLCYLSDALEIIGNKFDNPELLEEK